MEINLMDVLNLVLAAVGIFLGGKALYHQKTYVENSTADNLCGTVNGNVNYIKNENCDADKINEISQGVAQKEIKAAKEDLALKWGELGVDEDGTLSIINPFDKK